NHNYNAPRICLRPINNTKLSIPKISKYAINQCNANPLKRKKRYNVRNDTCPGLKEQDKITHLIPKLKRNDSNIVIKFEEKEFTDIAYTLFLHQLIHKILPGLSKITIENLNTPLNDDLIEIARLIKMIRLRGTIAQQTYLYNYLVDKINENHKLIQDAANQDVVAMVLDCQKKYEILKQLTTAISDKMNAYKMLLQEQREYMA
ncbi:hypothetical protein COBT_004021, partial [Conglomerata obtusa]